MVALNPQQIIGKKIKKDYPNEKITSTTYNDLERILIRNLKKNSKTELNEIWIDTDMMLQCIDLEDFDKFMGIRVGYYAIVLALFAIIFNSTELMKELTIDIKVIVSGGISFMIFLFVSHNFVTRSQKKELIYYRFKLKCIDQIINSKEIIKTK